MTGPTSDIQAQLKALQADYAARLPDRATELATRFAALRAAWCPTEANELRRLAHNLAGSGASYGFPAVSVGARRVERTLDAALAEPSPPSSATLEVAADALRDLLAVTSAVRLD